MIATYNKIKNKIWNNFGKVPKGVKPIIHQSELRTYTKVVPFKENSSFRFVVLWQILNGME
jgi:hypothetical protein